MTLSVYAYFCIFQWEWTVPLKDVSVKELESALFECEFSITDVNTTWTVNGEPVPEASPKYGIKRDGKKHTLDISQCRPRDQGEVTCTYADYTTTAKLAVEGE